MSARKLHPYFQSHAVIILTTQPLRIILHSPSQSGRIAKWAVELNDYDIEYMGRTVTKSQVLADFLIELAHELISNDQPEVWSPYVDGSSFRQGSGIDIQLEYPTGYILEQSFCLAFLVSKNEADYEALIAGLRLAKEVRIKKVRAKCDFHLVANQFGREYEAKDGHMEAYLKVVKKLSAEFLEFILTKISQGYNTSADTFVALASTSDPTQRYVIPVESIDYPNIDLPKGVYLINAFQINELGDGIDNTDEPNNLPLPPEETCDPVWWTEILLYIEDGICTIGPMVSSTPKKK